MAVESVQPMSREQAAILFADAPDVGVLLRDDEANAYRRVRDAWTLFGNLITDYGGRLIDHSEDGVFATFASADDALRFAVASQADLHREAAWQDGVPPLALRIGIHHGEIALEADRRPYGNDVNVAARLPSFVAPGGICVSAVLCDALVEAQDVTFRSLGKPVLKNIDARPELFVVSPRGITVTGVDRPPLVPAVREQAADLSIIVLPISNETRYPGDEHLCDGITTELIHNLTRFRDLAVIAPHSALLLKDTTLPLPEVGSRLDARYAITGQFSRFGSRLRLEVQLVETATGRQIWHERSDGKIGDVFAFEDEVVSTIAGQLAFHISDAARRRLLRTRTPNLLAYGLILRGQDLSLRFRREANLHARRLFEQARDVDPTYGRSWAGLSRTFNLAGRYGWAADQAEALKWAVDLARKAIEHDPTDARGYSELGYAHLYKKDHDLALNAYDHALMLNPNDADILAEMALVLSCTGDPARGLGFIQRAIRLNPFSPDLYYWIHGELFFDLECYPEAVVALERMSDMSEAHRLLASSYAHMNDTTRAAHHAREILRLYPGFTCDEWVKVPPDQDGKSVRRFIEGLRRAGLS